MPEVYDDAQHTTAEPSDPPQAEPSDGTDKIRPPKQTKEPRSGTPARKKGETSQPEVSSLQLSPTRPVLHDVSLESYKNAANRVTALFKSWKIVSNGFDLQFCLAELDREILPLFPAVNFHDVPTGSLPSLIAQFSRTTRNKILAKISRDYAAELDITSSDDGLYDIFACFDRGRPFAHHMVDYFSTDPYPSPRGPSEGLAHYIRRVEQTIRMHQLPEDPLVSSHFAIALFKGHIDHYSIGLRAIKPSYNTTNLAAMSSREVRAFFRNKDELRTADRNLTDTESSGVSNGERNPSGSGSVNPSFTPRCDGRNNSRSKSPKAKSKKRSPKGRSESSLNDTAYFSMSIY